MVVSPPPKSLPLAAAVDSEPEEPPKFVEAGEDTVWEEEDELGCCKATAGGGDMSTSSSASSSSSPSMKSLSSWVGSRTCAANVVRPLGTFWCNWAGDWGTPGDVAVNDRERAALTWDWWEIGFISVLGKEAKCDFATCGLTKPLPPMTMGSESLFSRSSVVPKRETWDWWLTGFVALVGMPPYALPLPLWPPMSRATIISLIQSKASLPWYFIPSIENCGIWSKPRSWRTKRLYSVPKMVYVKRRTMNLFHKLFDNEQHRRTWLSLTLLPI